MGRGVRPLVAVVVGVLALAFLPGSRAVAEGPPDTTPPVVQFVEPSPGRFLSGTVTATARITDDRGVATGELWAGDLLLGRVSSPPYTVSFDTTRFPDGPLALRWRGIDTSGNLQVFTREVFVANTAPPLSVPWATTPPRWVTGVARIDGTTADLGRPILVELWVNGELVGTTTTTKFSFALDTLDYADGPAQVEVTATDEAGRRTTSELTLQIRNDPPPVAISLPLPGAEVRHTVEVIPAIDPEITVTGLLLRVNGQDHVQVPGNPPSIPLDVEPYTGRLELEMAARDDNGLWTFGPVRVVYVDRHPPVVRFLDTDGAPIAEGSVLSVEATDDSGIGRVVFATDGQTIGVVTQEPYQVTWEPSPRAKQTVTITATVTDLVGKVTTVSQTRTHAAGRGGAGWVVVLVVLFVAAGTLAGGRYLYSRYTAS